MDGILPYEQAGNEGCGAGLRQAQERYARLEHRGGPRVRVWRTGELNG